MNDCELCLKNFDIEEIISSGEYDEIYSKISAFQDCIKELLYEKEYAKFEETLVYQERINAWISAKYEAEKNTAYLVGLFLGYLSALEINIESYYKNLSTALLSEKLLCADIPHLDDILFSIESNEGIRHGQLADLIGIDKSTLTGIMEKIVSIGAAYFSRPGKFKHYYLSTDGKNYCNEHRVKHTESKKQRALQKQEEKENKKTTLVTLMNEMQPRIYLSNTPDTSGYKVNETLLVDTIYGDEPSLFVDVVNENNDNKKVLSPIMAGDIYDYS